MANNSHNRGYLGEQSMGFFLGEQGYFFVEGPSGAAGHGVTTKGFDGVAFNPKTRQLIIYDNKAFAGVGNVSRASAIDPAKNLGQNLDGLIKRVQTMTDMPYQSEILSLLRQTRRALQTGTGWPSNVQLSVSNASGRVAGVTGRLAKSGIRFIDYYHAPHPLSAHARSLLTKQAVAAALAGGLSQFFQWLSDKGIEQKIRHILETEKAAGIQTRLERGEGVLIVIRLQEWERPNDLGMRGRMLLSVHTEGGLTEQEAIATWKNTPRMLAGPPKGWRVLTQYGWIRPVPEWSDPFKYKDDWRPDQGFGR
jgi:hypothetical protein